jgi:hypothetical protein
MAEKRAWLTNPTTGEKLHAWSHVKSIFYNKAADILLKDKLDEMDKLIDEKIKKAMMSNVQINDQNKVPTSALAFAMNQAITQNKNAITQLNSEIIQSSGSTPAIKGNTCTITTIKIKAGHRYIILGKAATNAGNSSIMSCKIQVDSGIAKTTGGSDTRTTMESGGGCVNWMYAEPQTDSVIALRGYGYANIEYNYEGILLGLQLR